MSSVIVVARTSSARAEDAGEGEHVVDLVREVAASGRDDGRVPAAMSGWTSGSGLASAKMIAPGAILATASSATLPADRPMKTSAPRSAVSIEPAMAGRVGELGQLRLDRVRPSRPCVEHPLAVGHADVADARRRAGSWTPRHRPRRPRRPRPAGRARLATTRAALRSAASTTIAVPCWSSWKTGMSSAARSRSSISKQRGAEMSSRLMPPKLGASAGRPDDLVDIGDVEADRHRVDAGECLNSSALPSITGMAARRADVAEPEYRGAVGDHRDVLPPGVDVGESGRRRSRCRPGPRRACRPCEAARLGNSALVPTSILPPRCIAKTGSVS